jgi:hypothetical protein
VTGWRSLEWSGSRVNGGGLGCAWWLRAETERETGREWSPDSVHHTEGIAREGGGPGGDFTGGWGPTPTGHKCGGCQAV